MSLLIRNVRLADGTISKPIPTVSVEVENSIISWIGEDASHPISHSHTEEIDGRGFTLIPGLIDCHEHFTSDGGPDNAEILVNDPLEVATLKAVGNARRALLSGVTSARDVGAKGGINIPFAKSVAAATILGPRILAAGEWLAFAGTWGSFVRTLANLEEIVLATKEQVHKGAALIKVGATGMTPEGEQFPTLGLDVLKAVVKTATAAGLKVAAHCVGYEGTHQAVEAGVASIEHGTFVSEETAQLMAAKGTYLVPTMSTWDARLTQAYMAKEPKDKLTTAEERAEESKSSFKRALSAGVKIVPGSDAGGSAVRHGMLAREIELMVETGMSPSAALRASTSDAADLLGIADIVGTIAVGKIADMVLIDGDPYSSPSALRNVWGVFQAGKRIR
ncbi:MAG: Imidazolonepropionase [Chloroflexi bacterium]|jgi:imidazolonepropionase-like amidohydrolase|nr:MAG: Imidazolonepropionase [Chloroflexota bacterium]